MGLGTVCQSFACLNWLQDGLLLNRPSQATLTCPTRQYLFSLSLVLNVETRRSMKQKSSLWCSQKQRKIPSSLEWWSTGLSVYWQPTRFCDQTRSAGQWNTSKIQVTSVREYSLKATTAIDDKHSSPYHYSDPSSKRVTQVLVKHILETHFWQELEAQNRTPHKRERQHAFLTSSSRLVGSVSPLVSVRYIYHCLLGKTVLLPSKFQLLEGNSTSSQRLDRAFGRKMRSKQGRERIKRLSGHCGCRKEPRILECSEPFFADVVMCQSDLNHGSCSIYVCQVEKSRLLVPFG